MREDLAGRRIRSCDQRPSRFNDLVKTLDPRAGSWLRFPAHFSPWLPFGTLFIMSLFINWQKTRGFWLLLPLGVWCLEGNAIYCIIIILFFAGLGKSPLALIVFCGVAVGKSNSRYQRLILGSCQMLLVLAFFVGYWVMHEMRICKVRKGDHLSFAGQRSGTWTGSRARPMGAVLV